MWIIQSTPNTLSNREFTAYSQQLNDVLEGLLSPSNKLSATGDIVPFSFFQNPKRKNNKTLSDLTKGVMRNRSLEDAHLNKWRKYLQLILDVLIWFNLLICFIYQIQIQSVFKVHFRNLRCCERNTSVLLDVLEKGCCSPLCVNCQLHPLKNLQAISKCYDPLWHLQLASNKIILSFLKNLSLICKWSKNSNNVKVKTALQLCKSNTQFLSFSFQPALILLLTWTVCPWVWKKQIWLMRELLTGFLLFSPAGKKSMLGNPSICKMGTTQNLIFSE